MRTAKWLVVAAAALTAMPAWSQAYPTKPVRIVVPFAPGGATDIVTRVVAQKLTEVWGQTVVADNRAGASGNIGAEIVARAPADGYTILMASGSVVTANQHMFRKLAYNAEKDFAAITNVASGPQIIAVHPTLPTKTLKDFIALARKQGKQMTFGSAGVATQTHLAAENFLYTAKLELVHVPYKGEGPALTDLVAGQIHMVTPNLSAAIGFVQQGKLRALAVTSKERVKQLPNVAAAAETLPGFENLGWFGLVAPANTPKAVIDKIYQDTLKVLQAPDIRNRFETLGMFPVGNDPVAFAAAMREESARWARIIKERKLQID
ncbi:MAG TPA: tripartite tricarboxylate transporter substrate binding protein [Burkholderiales bacterium]|nr:tripartite tricarboxylate transporter substrate binding protein [Burkholderiales bacterium]